MGRLVNQQFFYDGFWKEGTASYHQHTVRGLRQVLKTLCPDLSAETLDARIRPITPTWRARCMRRTRCACRTAGSRLCAIPRPLRALRRDRPLPRPTLLPGLGCASSAWGQTTSSSRHLSFTGRFGHNHYDSLGLLLYAFGKGPVRRHQLHAFARAAVDHGDRREPQHRRRGSAQPEHGRRARWLPRPPAAVPQHRPRLPGGRRRSAERLPGSRDDLPALPDRRRGRRRAVRRGHLRRGGRGAARLDAARQRRRGANARDP